MTQSRRHDVNRRYPDWSSNYEAIPEVARYLARVESTRFPSPAATPGGKTSTKAPKAVLKYLRKVIGSKASR